ncbi:WD40 repeat domain-containing protein, partial [Candidatus Poribacteria bacterium]|nr:WD40 repeat domain-containing protein [Candidatus Poribacteria bacterium]
DQGGRKLGTHTGWAKSVSWSPDGKLIASYGHDHVVRVWDCETGEETATLVGHTDSVQDLAWSPDGRFIASGGEDLGVRVWDVHASTQVWRSPYRRGWVLSVHWSSDGRCIVSGDALGVVRVWDLQTGKETWTLAEAAPCSWSSDGRLMARGDSRGAVRVWDMETRKLRRTLDGHTGRVGGISWSSDERLVVCRDSAGVVRVWDTHAGEEIHRLEEPAGALSWSPDGRRLLSVSHRDLRVWDAQTGQTAERPLKAERRRLLSISWSPDGRILVLKLDDGALEVWDTATWEVVAAVYEGGIGLPWQPPDERAFHPTRPLLATKGVRPSERIRILEFDVDALVGASG